MEPGPTEVAVVRVPARPSPATDLLAAPTGCLVLPSAKVCVAGSHGLALLLASGKRPKAQPRN